MFTIGERLVAVAAVLASSRRFSLVAVCVVGTCDVVVYYWQALLGGHTQHCLQHRFELVALASYRIGLASSFTIGERFSGGTPSIAYSK